MTFLRRIGFIILIILSLMGIFFTYGILYLFFGIDTSISRRDKPIHVKDLATVDSPLKSPSGKYQLEVVTGYNGIVKFNRFYIAMPEEGSCGSDKMYIATYASPDTFLSKKELYFTWDQEDRVWVYSKELGTYYWTKTDDKVWQKHIYADEKIPVPEVLKRLVPKDFK